MGIHTAFRTKNRSSVLRKNSNNMSNAAAKANWHRAVKDEGAKGRGASNIVFPTKLKTSH